MDCRKTPANSIQEFVHKHFLWLIIGSYVAAAFFPGLGLWVRGVYLGKFCLFGVTSTVRPPIVMLSILLMNAGLAVKAGQIRETLRSAHILAAGLTANTLVPIAFVFGLTQVMRGWHNADELGNILIGLALVISMPIAASSTAWAQNADGDLALSLGMVLFSTLLSPLITPAALHVVGLMVAPESASGLHEIDSASPGLFLAFGVLTPSLLGIALRWVIGDGSIQAAKAPLKFVNALIILILNYSNASVALPQAVSHPDLDFLGVTLFIVVALCALAFWAGSLISGLTNATTPQRTSLMFGLGMNNNGTGLVFASVALADHPGVMLPIIFYNLVQHLAAGIVDRFIPRQDRTSGGFPAAVDAKRHAGKAMSRG